MGGRTAARGRLRDRVRRVRAPGRGNVFARLAGADPSRGALLVHGHLDVVPAEPADWSVHRSPGRSPTATWGRGAVDMKDMCGMMIAVARHFKRAGIVPPRDLVFAFVADEEAGGKYGARWLVENRPDLFDGITEAVGEVAASRSRCRAPDGSERRLYLIETAEKGMLWMRLKARGRAGHGSFIHDDNAVTTIADAVARLGRHQFPIVVHPRSTSSSPRSPGRPATPSTWTHPTSTARSPSWARSRGSSAPPCATPRTRPCSRPATRPA